MNILRKAAAYMVRRLSLTDPNGWRGGGGESHAGETVNEGSVLGLSAAWACINLLAGTIASLPLMVYREDAKGVRTVAKDHPLYRLLHDSPNADQTALDFWEFGCASIELWGNAYAHAVRSGDRIVALQPVPPDIMTVRRLQNGALEYRWSQNGQSFVEPQANMLHIRGFGGDPIGGMSTLSYGRNTFGLAAAIDRSAGAMFRNGMRPSGVLTLEKFLTKEQREIVDERITKQFMGAMNDGRPFIAEGGMGWNQLSIKPEDAQMLQSRGFSVEEVCRFFGVPPFMIGHNEKSSGYPTSLEQQVLTFQKFTLRRRLKRIEQAIGKQLLTPADRGNGVTVEFNLEGLLRGDSAARSAFYGAMLNAGVMTINEVRALENLPPVPGGDVPRMQSQNVPITLAGLGHNGGPPLKDAA